MCVWLNVNGVLRPQLNVGELEVGHHLLDSLREGGMERGREGGREGGREVERE